jgi:hypothetical protein
MAYGKRHKNNAEVRAATAERVRQHRERKRQEKEVGLSADKIWADNLALLPADERAELLRIQEQTVEMIAFIQDCLEEMNQGRYPVYLDVTYEDARKMKSERGTYKYCLSKKDIEGIYGSIRLDNPIVRGTEPVPAGDISLRFLLLAGDRQWNLFGLYTRLPESLYHEFLVKTAEHLRDHQHENFDPDLAAAVIQESGIPPKVVPLHTAITAAIKDDAERIKEETSAHLEKVNAFEKQQSDIREKLQQLLGRQI